MFKNLFKSKKETNISKVKTEKSKVEKLNTKELGNVVGGALGVYVSIKGAGH